MRVADIDRINDRSFSEALSGLKIWKQELEDLSDIKLIAAHKLLENRVGEDEADKAIKMIIQGVRRAQYFGEIDEFPLKMRKSQIVTIADFNSHLSAFDKMEQRAFLFALDSGIHIRDVAGMTFKIAQSMKKQKKLGKTASDILDSSLRHIAHDKMFWFYNGRKAVAMYDIDSIVLDVIDMSWDKYVEQVMQLEPRPF